MTHSAIYLGNTSIIELDELADQNGSYQNDATVTLEALVDKETGDAVAGVGTPLSMSYVPGSDGRFQGTIDHGADIDAGKIYLATVRAVSAGGQRGQWIETLLARVRQA